MHPRRIGRLDDVPGLAARVERMGDVEALQKWSTEMPRVLRRAS
jgi:hypothetical protein